MSPRSITRVAFLASNRGAGMVPVIRVRVSSSTVGPLYRPVSQPARAPRKRRGQLAELSLRASRPEPDDAERHRENGPESLVYGRASTGLGTT